MAPLQKLQDSPVVEIFRHSALWDRTISRPSAISPRKNGNGKFTPGIAQQDSTGSAVFVTKNELRTRAGQGQEGDLPLRSAVRQGARHPVQAEGQFEAGPFEAQRGLGGLRPLLVRCEEQDALQAVDEHDVIDLESPGFREFHCRCATATVCCANQKNGVSDHEPT